MFCVYFYKPSYPTSLKSSLFNICCTPPIFNSLLKHLRPFLRALAVAIALALVLAKLACRAGLDAATAAFVDTCRVTDVIFPPDMEILLIVEPARGKAKKGTGGEASLYSLVVGVKVRLSCVGSPYVKPKLGIAGGDVGLP